MLKYFFSCSSIADQNWGFPVNFISQYWFRCYWKYLITNTHMVSVSSVRWDSGKHGHLVFLPCPQMLVGIKEGVYEVFMDQLGVQIVNFSSPGKIWSSGCGQWNSAVSFILIPHPRFDLDFQSKWTSYPGGSTIAIFSYYCAFRSWFYKDWCYKA